MIPMILTAQDRNALMEAIEVIQAVQNRRQESAHDIAIAH